MVAYLDAGQERIAEHSATDFEQLVESVRVGTVFAHDAKAFKRWRGSGRRLVDAGRRRGDGAGSPGQKARLEQAIAGLAATHPQYVVMGPG